MSIKSVAAIALLVLVGTACETSKPERSQAGGSAEATDLASQSDDERLISRAQQVRDRDFEDPPTLTAVDSAEELPQPTPSADDVGAERELLLEQLFDAGDAASEIARPKPPFAELAGFDADENEVRYLRTHSDSDELEAAKVAALIEALDAQHFDALPQPDSWDAELALEAARQATVTFGLAAHLLDEHPGDVQPSLLARRPELAQTLPILGTRFEAGAQERGRADELAARLQALTLRNAWTLAASLFRSSGWSAVELARLSPPERSADVVRSDQWMAGEPVGRWSWPEQSAEPAQSGLVGPAVAALWLQDVVEPQVARAAFSGYITDAYRRFEATDDSAARFEWLSLWGSPDSARDVAGAFEMRLRKRFADSDDPDAQFVVFQKGLTVGVIIAQMPQEQLRERGRRLLDAHTVQLDPREGPPVSYVPTRQDELAEQMQRAELDERVWRDPATNLVIDLGELGDEWSVNEPDRGPVRWFATHQSGSLLQLTVELDDPLGPSFAGEAYRSRLLDAFEASMRDAKRETIAASDTLPGPGLTVRLSGTIDGQPRTVQLWQFARADLVVSYSLQAPPQRFDAHRSLAKSILDQARPLSEDDDEPEQDEPSGIIEYEIEDE
jgi:hypothetical protein